MPVIHIAGADRPELREAVEQGGGRVGPLDEADGLVWIGGDPAALPPLPDSVRWVQLPSAGVEQWVASGVLDGRRTFTSAVGTFALPVAEHALALMLAADKALH